MGCGSPLTVAGAATDLSPDLGPARTHSVPFSPARAGPSTYAYSFMFLLFAMGFYRPASQHPNRKELSYYHIEVGCLRARPAATASARTPDVAQGQNRSVLAFLAALLGSLARSIVFGAPRLIEAWRDKTSRRGVMLEHVAHDLSSRSKPARLYSTMRQTLVLVECEGHSTLRDRCGVGFASYVPQRGTGGLWWMA